MAEINERKKGFQSGKLCQVCYQGIQEGSNHKCSASTKEAVNNLTTSLPKDVQEKLSLEVMRRKIREKDGGILCASGGILLSQVSGGKLVPVHLGHLLKQTPVQQLSHQELQIMANNINILGA